MRRKDDDKRVLTGRPDNNNTKSRRRFRNRQNQNQFLPARQNRQQFNRRNQRQRKANKMLILLLVIALAAFVIGAGCGVFMEFEQSNNSTPEYENVTVEMTTNLNETPDFYYDKDLDGVDYNNQEDLNKLNITNETQF